MSGDPEFACSFRDSNTEILNIIKLGSYKQDPSDIFDILNDKYVKSKLSKALNYYSKPNADSKAKLNSSLKWGSTQPLTNMMKTYLLHLSSKLDLDEELTFRLVELFFITHPYLFEKVRSTENEEVKKELSSIVKPITALYYKERIALIKAVSALILSSHDENNPCQAEFMQFLGENFVERSVEELIWDQYEEVCKKELPPQVFVPHEREEWYLQVLEEEKALLELLVFCNYTFAHPKAKSYLGYLELYVLQDFQGSYKAISNDQHLAEYRHQLSALADQIGDLSLFHLLSSIRLDIFTDKGSIPEFNPNKNPYTLISDKEFTNKIHQFFNRLSEGTEFVREHIGPVIVSWIALVTWGKGFPSDYTFIGKLDMSSLEMLASHYYIFDFFQKITQREPFAGSNTELSCALKYILMSLISRLHTALNVEHAKNYSLLVKTTCACLESIGNYDTLNNFWRQDYPNRSGLYLMLDILSKKYPNAAEEYLQFVSVLIGDNSCSFAREIVDYLSKLQYFTVNVDEDCIESLGDGRLQCKYELSSDRIVIPRGTPIENAESAGRGQYVVTWKVRFSLWPVLFNFWESTLERLKQGHSINEGELRVFSQYLEILCKIIILDPTLATELEEYGLQKPANNPLEVKVTVQHREINNQIISEYLLDTFIELSRVHSPLINTLASILEALKCIYLIESNNIELNPLSAAFKKVVLSRHGFGSLNSPHPLFISLNRLRVLEKSSENFSITYSMLELCITIFQHNYCMRVLPINSITFINEALKSCLSEVLPEALLMPGLYKWRNSYLCLMFLNTLLERYCHFLGQNEHQCLFIEMILNQLNKVALSGFLETVLQVVVQQSEFSDVEFYNLHWSQTDDLEEICLIQSMISAALNVLQKLLDIILYIRENGNNSFVIQAAEDVYRLIYSNSSTEELPLVSALLSYVPFYLKNAKPDDIPNENIAVLALQCLTKIVLIWEKSPQKNSLDYFTAGMYQDIRKELSLSFEDCIGDNSSLTAEVKYSVTLAFLEFLIAAVPSQKAFIAAVLANIDITIQFKRIFQNLREIDRESISSSPLSMFFHLLCLFEQLITESSKYPGLSNRLVQDPSLLNSAVDTIQSLLFNKKDPSGFESCVFLQSYATLFRIVTQHLQQKVFQNTVDAIFNPEVLENFLGLSSKVNFKESTFMRLADIEAQGARQGSFLGVSEFLIKQSHNAPYWCLFECNLNQYGNCFKFDPVKLAIAYASLDRQPSAINESSKALETANIEFSHIDAQLISLSSFKILIGYVTSFGYSGKINSALHTEVPQPQIKGLLISGKQAVHENLKDSFEILQIVVESTWKGINTSANFKNSEVLACLNQKFEILMFAYSFIIHMNSTKLQHRSDDSEYRKSEFKRLSGIIMAELVDLYKSVSNPSHEMLGFTHVLLGFFAKTCGFESKPEQYLYALVQSLSKCLHQDSVNFALLLSCLEYVLQLSDKQEYVNIFKPLPCNRIIVEKLSDEKCTVLECLFVFKYLTSVAKTAAGSKFLLSLKVFSHIHASACLRGLQNEYESRQRHPKHILWCWLLILLNQIAESLVSDQISISQLMSFISEFSGRINHILEFNYIHDNNSTGEVLNQKQFSLGYLEELEITISLVSRMVDCYSLLKKNDKDKVDYWIALMASHCMRIFNANTDITHTFPPIADHEQKLFISSLEPLPETSAPDPIKPRRSIFDPAPRAAIQVKLKKSTQISIFSYRVQTTLNYLLENLLSTFINHYQSTRALPTIDIFHLLGSSKFLVSTFTLIANNKQFYVNLDRMCIEEFRDPEVTSINGGITQRYEIAHDAYLRTSRKNFEMVFYLVMKYDLGRVGEVKTACSAVLEDWIKAAEVETVKGEPKDPYLAYILDQISS